MGSQYNMPVLNCSFVRVSFVTLATTRLLIQIKIIYFYFRISNLNVQTALAIRGFGIRGFDYLRT
jgi:hypothetical protein